MQGSATVWVVGKWLIIGGAILGTAYFLWKSLQKSEQRVRSGIEDFAEAQVARYLSEKLNQSIPEIRTKLSSRQIPQEFREQYSAVIASVRLVFRRRDESCEVETVIEPSSGSAFSAKKRLSYDDLPEKVQEKFLRGDEELQLPWMPSFMA